MKTIRVLGIIFSSIFLMSCDPNHEIIFENTGKKDVKVKLIIDKKIRNDDLNDISLSDSIVFKLKPFGTKENTSNIDFGMGVWDETGVSELSKSIKSIEIDNIDKKVIYKSESSIKDVLTKNQTGFYWKTVIKIETE